MDATLFPIEDTVPPPTKRRSRIVRNTPTTDTRVPTRVIIFAFGFTFVFYGVPYFLTFLKFTRDEI